jgi:hypothetical protein
MLKERERRRRRRRRGRRRGESVCEQMFNPRFLLTLCRFVFSAFLPEGEGERGEEVGVICNLLDQKSKE